MDVTTARRLADLYRAMQELADATSPDLTLRQALVLLYVGSQQPVAQGDVVDRLNLGKSTTSKIIGYLGGVTDGVKFSEEGLGLVSSDSDPGNRRSKLLALTRSGETLLSRVAKHIRAG